jgi:hypothetical protein
MPTRRLLDPLLFPVAAFCLMWSAAFTASKIAVGECPPLILLMTRCLIAAEADPERQWLAALKILVSI